jgi:hypothetical protein
MLGRAARMNDNAPTVINPSPIPINACTPAKAGNASINGDVPEILNCTATATEAITIETHPAANPPNIKSFIDVPNRLNTHQIP